MDQHHQVRAKIKLWKAMIYKILEWRKITTKRIGVIISSFAHYDHSLAHLNNVSYWFTNQ